MKHTLLHSLLLLAVASLLTACDKSETQKIQIAVVPQTDNTAMSGAKRAAIDASATYDIKVRWDISREATAASQNQLIETLTRNGIDGILIDIIDPVASKDAIDQAIASGVTIATFGSDAPGSRRSFYIGPDNAAAGRLAGETLRNLCIEANRAANGIGLFLDNPASQGTDLRLHNFVEAIPDTAAAYYSYGQPTTGQEQLTTFLTQNAGLPVNGIVLLSPSAQPDAPAAITRLDSLCNTARAPALFFGRSKGIETFVRSAPHCAILDPDYGAIVTTGIRQLLTVMQGGTVEPILYTPVTVLRAADLPAPAANSIR